MGKWELVSNLLRLLLSKGLLPRYSFFYFILNELKVGRLYTYLLTKTKFGKCDASLYNQTIFVIYQVWML